MERKEMRAFGSGLFKVCVIFLEKEPKIVKNSKEIFVFSEKQNIKWIDKLFHATLLFQQTKEVMMASLRPHLMLRTTIRE
jgi:hypothetical protein